MLCVCDFTICSKKSFKARLCGVGVHGLLKVRRAHIRKDNHSLLESNVSVCKGLGTLCRIIALGGMPQQDTMSDLCSQTSS